MHAAGKMFGPRRGGLGITAFPAASSNLSQPYKTARRAAGRLRYCGYCERYACEMYAKSSPQTTILRCYEAAEFRLRPARA